MKVEVDLREKLKGEVHYYYEIHYWFISKMAAILYQIKLLCKIEPNGDMK